MNPSSFCMPCVLSAIDGSLSGGLSCEPWTGAAPKQIKAVAAAYSRSLIACPRDKSRADDPCGRRKEVRADYMRETGAPVRGWPARCTRFVFSECGQGG